MSNKRTLFYLLFIFIIIIFLYNYVINPALIQSSNNSGVTMNISMGMGMHSAMDSNNNYYINNNSNYSSYIEGFYFMILVILTAISFVILNRMFLKKKSNSCNKCGYKIEDEKWRRCPACGNNLEEKRNGK